MNSEETKGIIIVNFPLPSGAVARLVSDCQVGIAILAWIVTYNLWLSSKRRKYASALQFAEELYRSVCRC